MYIMKLITEAAFVGGSLVTYALLVTLIMDKLIPKKSVSSYSRMIMGIFITGFTMHLVFELTRVNKYYCMNGNACKNIM